MNKKIVILSSGLSVIVLTLLIIYKIKKNKEKNIKEVHFVEIEKPKAIERKPLVNETRQTSTGTKRVVEPLSDEEQAALLISSSRGGQTNGSRNDLFKQQSNINKINK
jgi:hypothetical protein